MAWGNQAQTDQGGVCPKCLKPKAGTMQDIIRGCGFGATEREGVIAVCVNSDCEVGRINRTNPLINTY